MSGKSKIILVVVISIIGALGLAYYGIMQIDFVGYKDPKVVAENMKRWEKMILSAEYRNGTDYCKVNLLDSVNIEVSVGDKFGGTFLYEKYKIEGDTIVVIGGIKHASKYLNSDKFLIKDSKLLFKLGNKGAYDTMDIVVDKRGIR